LATRNGLNDLFSILASAHQPDLESSGRDAKRRPDAMDFPSGNSAQPETNEA
jgi:hypothetical protein